MHFGSGFYFGPNAEETKPQLHQPMSVYLSADRLLDVGKPVENGKAYQYLIDNGYHPADAKFAMNYGDRFINALYDTLLDRYSQGGANVQVQNLLKEFGYDGVYAVYGVNNDKGQVVVFEASQIKSADPVVYDDNGNVIPLSERFNSSNDDIRYSLGEESPLGEGNELTDKDMNLKSRVPTSKDLSEQKTARVLEKAPEYNKSKDAWKRAKTVLKGKTISRYAAVEELADQTKNKKLVPLLDEVMRAQGRANVGIYEG